MGFIVGIERRPRGRMWSLRLGGKEEPDYIGLFRSFWGLNLKIKGELLHN